MERFIRFLIHIKKSVANAVVRKCRHDFFRDGDSGVFVYFLDERGKKQAFGFSVRELLNIKCRLGPSA